jgi:electron-transferring-flavoprotein dehydrogenase
MKTGMLGARAAFAACPPAAQHDELARTAEAFAQSWVYEDLYKVRNVKPGLKWGMWAGHAARRLHMWLNDLGLGALVPWTLAPRQAGHASLKPRREMPKIDYPKYDGVLTFDKLSSVFLSNTNHEETSRASAAARSVDSGRRSTSRCTTVPSALLPAGVYEFVDGRRRSASGCRSTRRTASTARRATSRIRCRTSTG